MVVPTRFATVMEGVICMGYLLWERCNIYGEKDGIDIDMIRFTNHGNGYDMSVSGIWMTLIMASCHFPSRE